MGSSNNADGKKGEAIKAKGLLQYDSKEKQTLFKFLGVEMTAPKDLKNPRVVYISFILVNILLLIILKNFIAN